MSQGYYFVPKPMPTDAERASTFAQKVLGVRAAPRPRAVSTRQRFVLRWLADGGRVLASEGFSAWRAWGALPSPAQKKAHAPYPNVPPATFIVLLRRKWIAFERITTHTMPEAFVYKITDAGRAALEASAP